MVRTKKMTAFLYTKENTLMRELKKMVTGITRVGSENQILYKDEQCVDDKLLPEYGLNSNTAKAQAPAMVGLAFGIPTPESSRPWK